MDKETARKILKQIKDHASTISGDLRNDTDGKHRKIAKRAGKIHELASDLEQLLQDATRPQRKGLGVKFTKIVPPGASS